MKKLMLAAAIMFSIVGPAKAWNCTDPLASRVDVGPTKPSGSSAGDGDGQYYIGTDAANPKDYYVCEVPKPPVTPPTSPTSSSQTQSQQQSQNTNVSNTNSNSNNNSNKSASTSNSSANSTSGSESIISGSGNSTNNVKSSNSLKDSGNSQNTNTNSASIGSTTNTNTLAAQGGAGGAGGASTSSAQSAASNNGNGANNSTYSSQTNVAASKIPVETAYAYAAQPTVNCASTYGAGGQGAAFGLSLSGTKIDRNCADLEAARKAPNRLSYCKVYIMNDYVRKAGVSLQDCLTMDVTTQVITPVPTPIAAVAPPIQVTVQLPPVEQNIATTPVRSQGDLIFVGDCRTQRYNTCVAFMNKAIAMVKERHGSRIIVYGPLASGRALSYLYSSLDNDQVEARLQDDQNDVISFSVWTVN